MSKKIEKVDKRTMIADAAMPIFANKGFKNTTIEDICTACGIANRTFYLHFKNKKEIFELVISDLQEKLTEIVREGILDKKLPGDEYDENEAYNFILNKNYSTFKMVQDNRDLFLMLIREPSSFDINLNVLLKKIVDSTLKLVKIEQNVFKKLGLVKDIDVTYSSLIIIGGMLMTIFYKIIEDDSGNIEMLAEKITSLQFYGYGIHREKQ